MQNYLKKDITKGTSRPNQCLNKCASSVKMAKPAISKLEIFQKALMREKSDNLFEPSASDTTGNQYCLIKNIEKYYIVTGCSLMT